jgi:phage baseplate assembly protein gpV
MTELISPPSRNLALDGTLVGLLTLFKDKMLQNLDDMLPAEVIAYDRATNRVQVQPLILMVTTSGIQVKRGQLASLPVLQSGGGGYVIGVPLQTGDLGWIKSNDRDITFFLKTYKQAAPNTARKHSFSDAVFIPDSFMKNVNISPEDNNSLVIQNLSGTIKISLSESGINITAPQITMTASDGITLNTPTVTISGSVNVAGSVSADGDVEAGTVSLESHTHPGVQTGGGNTGMPNP